MVVKETLIDWKEYSCGANGQIYSYYFKIYLNGYVDSDGYVKVKLKCIDGKQRKFCLHRVIWTFFYGTIPQDMQINHIDENKQNNALSNLNLMTPKENSNWGTRNERISEKQRGERNHMFGKHASEETKRKMSESHLNNPLKSKPVVAIDKDGNIVKEYPSAAEARRNGFNHVLDCCNGKLKTCGGYGWRHP